MTSPSSTARDTPVDPPPAVPLAIAVLTREKWTEVDRCLASLHAQDTVLDVPIHVLVNGSTDDTTERLRAKYPDVRVHVSEENLGCPGGRNLLMELIDAEWVAQIDDDGTVDATFLTAARREVELAPPDRAVVAGHIIDVDVDPDPERSSGPWFRFQGCICLIRRSTFLTLGGYPSDGYRQGEEGNYAIRLHDAGLTIWQSADLVIFHPLRHSPEKRRELLQTGLRQALLTGLQYAPWWFVPPWVVWKTGMHAVEAVKLRSIPAFTAGLRDAASHAVPTIRARQPVKLASILASSSRFSRSQPRC